MIEVFNNIYKGKTVLVTGHTGFKGSWLSIWLNELGAKVIGYAIDPYTSKDNFVLSGLSDKIIDIRGDVGDYEQLQSVFRKYQPDFVFHLAAQPLVRLSYEQPIDTYQTNVMGTIHLLECVRQMNKQVQVVVITSDKCYENKEQIWGYRESDPMGGHDPYSSSKGCTELVVSSWRNSFFNSKQYDTHHKALASARAGNVIGGGDWAKDRIIPDCIRALESGNPIEIRNPQATRPWQHVLEPVRGYLLLGERLCENPQKYAEGWNFGPEKSAIIPVWGVAQMVVEEFGSGEVVDVHNPHELHEAKLLSLDITKAIDELDWHPVMNIRQTVRMTVDWYKKYQTEDVYAVCVAQINEFNKV